MRYSPLKIFHYAEKLASLPRENAAILPPVHVRIKPTNACGHKCWYCAYRSEDLQLGRDMKIRDAIPRERMREIIDDLIDMGVKAVTFSGGGDPFYYPHLLETAERLADSPVRFASLTNGARLDGDLARVFARAASWVRISIDGWDGPSYARYRGVKETEFDRLVDNLRRFADLGGPCRLGLSVIVDRDNAPHVFELVELARNVGAASVKISPCITSDDAEEANRYHAPIYDLVEEQIAQARRAFASDTFEIYHAYHRQATEYGKPYTWCPFLQILPVIGADLRVYACQDKAYNRESGMLGSIEHMRFKDFWFNGKDKFFAINPALHCNHHCVAHAKNLLVLEYLSAGGEHGEFV